MNAAQRDESLLLSPRQAADRLGISERCMWDYLSPRGPIPVVRIGRLCKIDPRDLVAFIDGQKQGGVDHE